MLRSVVLLGIGMSLAVGCGRWDRPTVQRNTLQTASEKSAGDELVCPGHSGPSKTDPKRDAAARAKLAHSAAPDRLDVTPPAKSADTAAAADAENKSLAILGMAPVVGSGLAGLAADQDLSIAKVLGKAGELLPDPKSLSGKTKSAEPKAAVRATSTAANSAKPDVAARAAIASASPPLPASALPNQAAPVAPKTAGATLPKPAGPANKEKEVERRTVRFGNLSVVAPKTWVREHSAAGVVLAQFRLPGVPGDPNSAEVTVASAGEIGPKSLTRLREQLKQKPQEGSIEQIRVGDKEIVLVDNTGNYDGGDDPLPASTTEGRYRALNAVVFVGDQVFFVNCTGPEKIVGERFGEFRAFLETLKPADPS